jgi:hypothetical protein
MEITLTHILLVLIACFFAGALGYQHGYAP